MDVRSNPASRWARFANRRVLPRLLDEQGIRHEYMGDSLGGKPSDPALYEDGEPDYRKIAGSSEFQEGIVRLLGACPRIRSWRRNTPRNNLLTAIWT